MVVATEEGTVALNYTWLPTWMGMNNILLAEVRSQVLKEFKGKSLDEENLDRMHGRVVELLCEKYPMEGLGDYLNGLIRVDPSAGASS